MTKDSCVKATNIFPMSKRFEYHAQGPSDAQEQVTVGLVSNEYR